MTGRFRREKRSISTGITSKIKNGAKKLPPTTTTASGFWTCEPMPVEMAAGKRPTQATMQVIVTGRIFTVQAQAARYADTAALFQALGGGWWNRQDVAPAKASDLQLVP